MFWCWSTCYVPAPSMHTPALSLSVCVASGAALRPRVPVSILFTNCARVFWGVVCFTVGGGAPQHVPRFLVFFRILEAFFAAHSTGEGKWVPSRDFYRQVCLFSRLSCVPYACSVL